MLGIVRFEALRSILKDNHSNKKLIIFMEEACGQVMFQFLPQKSIGSSVSTASLQVFILSWIVVENVSNIFSALTETESY